MLRCCCRSRKAEETSNGDSIAQPEEPEEVFQPPPNRKRRLTAYVLWLIMPLGGHLLYLGRDGHCWFSFVTFNGLGINWILDFFYIPRYVRDHNEDPGEVEQAHRRLKKCCGIGIVFTPLRWFLQIVGSAFFGWLAFMLLPTKLRVPASVAGVQLPAIGVELPLKISNRSMVIVRFLLGSCVVIAATRFITKRIATIRCHCNWRPVILWSAGIACLCLSTPEAKTNMGLDKDKSASFAYLLFVAVGASFGTCKGRKFDRNQRPSLVTQRWLSFRLLRMMAGIVVFWIIVTIAYYMNGSVTYHDAEKNRQVTLTGSEALAHWYSNAGVAWQNVKEAFSALQAYCASRTWEQLWFEISQIFRDKRAEAAEVLGVPRNASVAEVRRAHRKLALMYHPDKFIGDSSEKQEEAKHMMERLNAAKDILSQAEEEPPKTEPPKKHPRDETNPRREQAKKEAYERADKQESSSSGKKGAKHTKKQTSSQPRSSSSNTKHPAETAKKQDKQRGATTSKLKVPLVSSRQLTSLMASKNKDLLVVFYDNHCPTCKRWVLQPYTDPPDGITLEAFYHDMQKQGHSKTFEVVRYDVEADPSLPPGFTASQKPKIYFVSAEGVKTVFDHRKLNPTQAGVLMSWVYEHASLTFEKSLFDEL